MPRTPTLEATRDALRRSMLAQMEEMTPDEHAAMLAYLTGYCTSAIERGWERGWENILERREAARRRRS